MKRRSLLKFLATAPVAAAGILAKDNKKEVFLFDFYLAGFKYYKAPAVYRRLKKGDIVILKPEPDNKYDEMAIEVYTKSNIKLGYVPMEANIVPYNLFKNDIEVVAKIEEIDLKAPDWEKILIRVYQRV
ncbi:MAG: HIRAN domain-containing protein [Ignavibacteria bacterium]|nr:HIRAN domain-containing protein [Ignavibacteria bacterium]